jgi:hypothetical protein
MTFTKTLSTLSLALALQAGAFIAATVVLSPSDAAAATHSKNKPQKKAPARKAKSTDMTKFVPPPTQAKGKSDSDQPIGNMN